MGSARENLVPQDMDIEKKPMDMTGSTREKSLRPQIERLPSVRTIPLKLNNTPLWERFISKTENGRSQKHKKAAAEMTPQRLLFMAGQRKSPEIKGFRAKRKGRQFLSKLPTFYGAAGGIRTHGTVASTPDFESFQPLWLLWFFRIAFRLFCPPETIAVSRCFGIHPWKKLDFSRGSNESQKWADFGSFVRIRVRNVRTMLEQHSIHRCLPPNKWQRCMLWKSMTLIGRKCRIFLLRNRCACFAIAANEQRSIIWKAESCRAFIRGRKPGVTKSGKKIWWLS